MTLTLLGHHFVQFEPLVPKRNARHYRCRLCKGRYIVDPGMGILDENSNRMTKRDIFMPQCKGEVSGVKKEET